jgi:hypothetical protein
VVASFPDARVVTPAAARWRSIVASADLNGEALNLFEFSVDPQTPRVRRTTGGANGPTCRPTTNRSVCRLHHRGIRPVRDERHGGGTGADASGHAVVATSPGPQRAKADTVVVGNSNRKDATTIRLGRHWADMVVAGCRRQQQRASAGCRDGTGDVLGYHAYSMSATWLLLAPTPELRRSTVGPDWELLYAYDRWRPTLFVTASSPAPQG